MTTKVYTDDYTVGISRLSGTDIVPHIDEKTSQHDRCPSVAPACANGYRHHV